MDARIRLVNKNDAKEPPVKKASDNPLSETKVIGVYNPICVLT